MLMRPAKYNGDSFFSPPISGEGARGGGVWAPPRHKQGRAVGMRAGSAARSRASASRLHEPLHLTEQRPFPAYVGHFSEQVRASEASERSGAKRSEAGRVKSWGNPFGLPKIGLPRHAPTRIDNGGHGGLSLIPKPLPCALSDPRQPGQSEYRRGRKLIPLRGTQ